MVFRVDTVITQHFKVLFRDVNNETFDEVHSRNTFSDSKLIFMSCVVEGYIVSVIVINAGGGNDRATKVSADVLDGDIGGTGIGLGSHIKTFRMEGIHVVFDLAKGRSQPEGEFIQKDLTERITKEGIVEMLDRTPWGDVTGPAF